VAYWLLTGSRRMIDALFNQTNYQAARAMLDVTATRHEAIASNLANLETPNYKRLDVNPSFEMELKQALASGDTEKLKNLSPTLSIDQTTTSTNRDGNSVVLEDELLALNQNTLNHTLETQMVTGTLLKLRMAITGRAA
jgi:flagellar basal-body rod protein FlgB